MKSKKNYTPEGWGENEKRPYNNLRVNRHIRKASDLSDGAKLVMEELSDSGYSKGKAWPKLEKLAAAIHHTKRNVLLHIRELEKLGYVIVERRHSTSCLFMLGPRLDSISPKKPSKPVDKKVDGDSIDTVMVTELTPSMVTVLTPSTSINDSEPLDNQDNGKTMFSEQNKYENKLKTNHSDTSSINGILNEVLNFTGDNTDRGNWVKKCSTVQPEIIRDAIKKTASNPRVRNRSAYLNTTIDKMMSGPAFSDDTYPRYVEPEPTGPRATDEEATLAMNKIKVMLSGSKETLC